GNVSDDVVARAGIALERPLAAMLDEVRSSLDYYRNQPGATRLLRIVATGGGALPPGIVDRLAAPVALPVQMAEPRSTPPVGQLADAQARQDQLDALRQQIAALVGSDVSWSRMLQDIARTIPNDVWLTSFQGTVTQAVPTPRAAPPAASELGSTTTAGIPTT